MSTLKARLETHPISNLNKVIKSVKSVLAPTLALSKDKKRHSKATLVTHILKLNSLGLLKKDIPVYKPPPRAKKQVKPKEDKPGKNIVIDLEKVKKGGIIKVDEAKAKAAGVKIIKKEKAPKKEESSEVISKEKQTKGQALIAKLMAPRKKKPRSEKQKANDKRLGEAAKKRAAAKRDAKNK